LNNKLTKYLESHILDFLFVLALISIFPFRGNFIAFHSLVELFSIVVAVEIFPVVWNSKDLVKNYLFIRIAFVFIIKLKKVKVEYLIIAKISMPP